MTQDHERQDRDTAEDDSSIIDEPDRPEPRRMTSDDFLVPGPTPESNQGLGRWGLSWLIFSILLMGLMLLLSFVCLQLALWTGIA